MPLQVPTGYTGLDNQRTAASSRVAATRRRARGAEKHPVYRRNRKYVVHSIVEPQILFGAMIWSRGKISMVAGGSS